MSNLNKVRVQLLDEITGALVEEVDVLTSAEAVTFADGQTFQQKLNAGTLKGDKGDTGATGTAGVKGADGKTWHITSAVPANTLGSIGDMHLNTATWDIREKTAASTWTTRGNIKGATGAAGATGAKGDKGDKGDPGTPGADGGSVKFGTAYETAANVRLFFKKV